MINIHEVYVDSGGIYAIRITFTNSDEGRKEMRRFKHECNLGKVYPYRNFIDIHELTKEQLDILKHATSLYIKSYQDSSGLTLFEFLKMTGII